MAVKDYSKEALEMHRKYKGKISVDLALDHLRAIRIADRDWLTRKIAELESESAAS